jgi:hypothetical protein
MKYDVFNLDEGHKVTSLNPNIRSDKLSSKIAVQSVKLINNDTGNKP